MRATTTCLLLVACLTTGPVCAGEPMPEGFVDATTVVPGLVVDMRYAGPHNFIGRPIDGYHAPVCILTRETAEALAGVQAELYDYGLGLKVFDCYRPTRAVTDFLRWAKDQADIAMQLEFYPDFEKSELFAEGYIADRSGHSRGSTVDLTLVFLADGSAVPMGTGFDFFSTRSWPTDPNQPPEVRANRLLLSIVMQKHGFKPYEREWWHFRLADEPFPDSYFDFPVE